jgi:hypothetical protein
MIEETIQDFYIASLEDVIEGMEIKELEWVLKDFEDEEMYEECAGIKKALDFIKKKTIKEIKKEYKELKHKDDEK